EVGGRSGKRRAAQFEQRLDFGVGKRRVDLHVELVDNLGGRIPRRPEAERAGGLLAGPGVARRRKMGMPHATPPRVPLRWLSADKLPRKTATKRAQEKRIGRNHDVHARARGAGPRRVYPGN